MIGFAAALLMCAPPFMIIAASLKTLEPSSPLLPAPPARGVLWASEPDGYLERRRVRAPPGLAPFVHHFWSVRWTLRAPFEAEVLLHPTARLIVETDRRGLRAEVEGVPTRRRLGTRAAGEGTAFGIAFRPAMFQPLFGASMTKLTDRSLPLEQVLGSRAAGWARALQAERDLEGKIAVAAELLEPLLTRAPPEVFRMRDLAERMATDRTLLRVEDACEAVDLDARTLQRWFRRYVGVSPKWVIQRFRLLEAAEQLKQPRPPSLATLAASLGYADQSHFARDFKKTIGRTPRSFMR